MAERRLSTTRRPSWSETDAFVPRTFVRPFQRFMHAEAGGAIVMLIAAIAALGWANSPWYHAQEALWETGLSIHLGELAHVDLTLAEWVNDALMAIFFFVVGLEIKRELVHGELRDPKKASLPVIAALGGMIVPAAIFTAAVFATAVLATAVLAAVIGILDAVGFQDFVDHLDGRLGRHLFAHDFLLNCTSPIRWG